MNSEPIKDADFQLVVAHCQQLIEHFDSVQIFVTRSEPEKDGTIHIARGTGNWFARYGQVAAWLTKENEAQRETMRGENEE